jgi:predicted negative regulator of RcsB-dependent stress response
MGNSNSEIVVYYKKNIEPYIAVFILAFVIVCCYMLYQDNQLKKEISHNCGWQEEKYKCYCDRSIVQNIESIINKIDNIPIYNTSWGLKNVSMAR